MTLKANAHHRRRHKSIVELSRVGGENAPIGSRDPLYNVLASDDIMTSSLKKLSISIKIGVMKNGVCLVSFQIVMRRFNQ